MDGNKEKPITELGLTIGPGNQRSRVGSNKDLGAGANAGSKEEMTFVTATPLSELVWSPNKGVSLKCADSSLPDKRFSFLCGVGSSNMVHSSPHSITVRETKDGVHVDEEKVSSPMESHLACKVSEEVRLVRIPTPRSTSSITPVCRTTRHEHNLGLSGGVEDMTSRMKVSALNIDQGDHSTKKENDICCQTEKASIPDPDNERRADSSSIKNIKPKFDLTRGELECRDFNTGTRSGLVEVARDVGSGNSHIAGMQGALSSEVSTVKQCKNLDTENPLITSHESKKEESAPDIEEGDQEKTNEIVSIPSLWKQESTAENDIQTLTGERACTEVALIDSQPADEGKLCYHQHEGILPLTEVPAVEALPSSSRVPLCQRNDNEKALWDEEDNEKISKDEDDSHESVESCNSTGLLSAGKRKWSFDQQLIVESKKMKQQDYESPHSGSLHKQDSSFMNWISNMIKGLSNSGPDDTPSLALTMRTNHGNRSNETSTGFQTIFKALYCPSSRAQDNKILTLDNHPGDHGSNELELANKVFENNSSPSAGDDKGKCKQIVLSNEKFNQRIPADGEGPSALPIIPSEYISFVQENREDSAKIRSLRNMACNPKKVGVISSGSSFQNDSDSPSEGKEASKAGSINPNKSINNLTNRNDSLGNLWITRFSPKVSGLVQSSPKCHQNVNTTFEGPTDRTKILSRAHNCIISRKDKNVLEDSNKPFMEDPIDGTSKNIQNYVTNSSGSFGFKRRERIDQKKCKSKVNAVHHSQRFKNSEALASVFARRLDALRRIIPSEVDGNASHATTTCFFCGIKGHKLQDCSEITGSEINDLLQKIYQYDGKEESSCLCIRCFQLNHWAVACPYSSTRKESHSNSSASLVNITSFGKMQDNPGNNTLIGDKNNPSVNKDFRCQIPLTASDAKNPRVETEVEVGKTFNLRMSGTIMASGLKPTEKDLFDETVGKNTSKDFILNGKQTTSSSTENVSRENQITDFCNFVHRHIPAVPRGTFEAVKRLRLSRTDILKWTKSPKSFYCLDGFFLRLRLRKWEEGVGGTGYFVACINGERSFGSHKLPLSVNIAGFKCLIESRFVSNHDYTEDELMAWWCAILRGGGQMPSEEDLKIKFEEKKKLGFYGL